MAGYLTSFGLDIEWGALGRGLRLPLENLKPMLSRGIYSGIGTLMVASSSKVVTYIVESIPYISKYLTWMTVLPPVSYGVFFAAAIPNAVAALGHWSAGEYLKANPPPPTSIDIQPIVMKITAVVCFAASSLIIAKISGIAAITILGCATMGWMTGWIIRLGNDYISYPLLKLLSEQIASIAKKIFY